MPTGKNPMTRLPVDKNYNEDRYAPLFVPAVICTEQTSIRYGIWMLRPYLLRPIIRSKLQYSELHNILNY